MLILKFYQHQVSNSWGILIVDVVDVVIIQVFVALNVVDSRKLYLKFGQNWVRNCWYIVVFVVVALLLNVAVVVVDPRSLS